jgi:hypothetical protein
MTGPLQSVSDRCPPQILPGSFLRCGLFFVEIGKVVNWLATPPAPVRKAGGGDRTRVASLEDWCSADSSGGLKGKRASAIVEGPA